MHGKYIKDQVYKLILKKGVTKQIARAQSEQCRMRYETGYIGKPCKLIEEYLKSAVKQHRANGGRIN